MGKIFISYRRADSEYVVGRIYEELCESYGKENIFKDIDSIPLGVDFRDEISKVVLSCDILIAIIGEEWGTIKDKSGNIRINNSHDFVRIEIEEALKRNIPVIPIITSHAEIPKADILPSSLKELAYRNALSIRPDPDFKNDIVRLKSDISKIVKKPFNYKYLFVFLSIVSLLIGSYFIINNRNLDEKDKAQNHLKTPYEVILKPEKLLASIQNNEQKKIIEKSVAQEISVKKVNKYNLRALVKDPKDSWVWLRKKPISIKSTEFLQISIGSIVNTYKQSENEKWWLVKTSKGEIGYMHTSRFDLIKEN